MTGWEADMEQAGNGVGVGGILSSIVVVVGWCGEMRGGPTTVGQWTRCCVCVKHV